jgi:hypothetical protein
VPCRAIAVPREGDRPVGARTNWRGWLGAALCAASVLFGGLAEAQAPSGSPPDARALLLSMAEFLGKTQQLSVTVHAGYDAIQRSGQKIEWNEVRTLALSRPSRLRMEVEKSDGARSLVVFDGKEISAYDEVGRVYAQAPQAGGIDEALVYFVRDLRMRLPLAALLLSRAGADLDRRVRSVEYVEKTGILGAMGHHLVGRTDTVDFQVWIADGDRPLPQRIVLTYPGAPGQPQFRAQFVAWNVAPELSDSLFMFTPPTDASRIPFAAALAQYGRATAPATAKKGAKR